MKAETGTGKYEQLLGKCKSLAPIPTAVAHPCEPSAQAGAVEASELVWCPMKDRQCRTQPLAKIFCIL